MKVPDPNMFDGPVFVRRTNDPDFWEVPTPFVKGYGRSIGAADMAHAIRSGRGFRATGEQALYVLDLMAGFLESAQSGRAYVPATKYAKPAAMRSDLPFGRLED
jgi:predicted dehydrogenase